jgi:hypothetical protein
MNYNTFPRKTYGCIFVEKEEDIPKVKEIIRKMDEYEYTYLPEGLIKVFTPDIRNFSTGILNDNPKDHLWLDTNYTGKFDSLNLNELQIRCWTDGIKIFCCMTGGKDYECYDVWQPEENNEVDKEVI